MIIDKIINGKAINMNFPNVIGWPSFAARPATITLALAPINVPFPPRHAPKDKLHHRGSKFVMPSSPISFIIGIMVATNGILSINAEAIALTQRIKIDVDVTSPPVRCTE